MERVWILLLPLSVSQMIAANGQSSNPGTASLIAPSSRDSNPGPLSGGNPAVPVSTESRRLALEAAGAFLNDGFRIRDGEWRGTLTMATPLFLSVTLFEGESYWFVGASPSRDVVLRLTVYDSGGKPIRTEQWKDGAQGSGSRCAAGVASVKSGRYFIGMEMTENPTRMPVDFSVVYAYK